MVIGEERGGNAKEMKGVFKVVWVDLEAVEEK